eukprot:365410-Chlamydomonas_euryale.AAC.2
MQPDVHQTRGPSLLSPGRGGLPHLRRLLTTHRPSHRFRPHLLSLVDILCREVVISSPAAAATAVFVVAAARAATALSAASTAAAAPPSSLAASLHVLIVVRLAARMAMAAGQCELQTHAILTDRH